MGGIRNSIGIWYFSLGGCGWVAVPCSFYGPKCRVRGFRHYPSDNRSFALQIAAGLVVQAIASFYAGLVDSSSVDGCLSHLVGGRMNKTYIELERCKNEMTTSERRKI